MSLLLEDLAEETSASNCRTAERLDAEAQALDHMRGGEAATEGFRHQAVQSARQATDYALSRVPEVEGLWRSGLANLREHPFGDGAVRLLNGLLKLFESELRLIRAARALWVIPEQFQEAPERLEELNGAEKQFEKMIREVKRARKHRANPKQPSDPERFALGLQMAREGKTVKAEEARNWFRRSPG